MPDSMTVLAFDFGMKRIGVAMGRTLLGVAKPLATLQAKQGVPDWKSVEKVIQE